MYNLVEQFNINEFTKTYRGIRKFTEESIYFQYFLNSLKKDKELFGHIIFCNDILQLPPVYVFVKYYNNLFNTQLSVYEKRSLGACFGYLFQNILDYNDAVSIWVGDNTTNIKNASYFIK